MPLFGKKVNLEEVKDQFVSLISNKRDQNAQQLLPVAATIINSDLAKQLDKDEKGDQLGKFINQNVLYPLSFTIDLDLYLTVFLETIESQVKETFAFKAGNSWTRFWISQKVPLYYINQSEDDIVTKDWAEAEGKLKKGLKFAEYREKPTVFVMVCKYYLGLCAINQGREAEGNNLFRESLAIYDQQPNDTKEAPKFKPMAEDMRKRLGK